MSAWDDPVAHIRGLEAVIWEAFSESPFFAITRRDAESIAATVLAAGYVPVAEVERLRGFDFAAVLAGHLPRYRWGYRVACSCEQWESRPAFREDSRLSEHRSHVAAELRAALETP